MDPLDSFEHHTAVETFDVFFFAKVQSLVL